MLLHLPGIENLSRPIVVDIIDLELAPRIMLSLVQIGPLILITIIFWRACRPVFAKPMSVLSLRTAVDMDYNDTYAPL